VSFTQKSSFFQSIGCRVGASRLPSRIAEFRIVEMYK
jgi:hypothetical protein